MSLAFKFGSFIRCRSDLSRPIVVRLAGSRRLQSTVPAVPFTEAASTINESVISESVIGEATSVVNQATSILSEGSSALPNLASTASEFILNGSIWNPTNAFAIIIDNLHAYSGTSWPVTIALFTIGLRAALFPFTAIQTRDSINANNLRPTIDKIRNESMQLRQANQLEQAKEKMKEMSAFMKENKIGVGRLLGFGVLPVPFFISTFFALQKLTQQPIPSMANEGMLWFQNLSLADPYYILPVMTTATLLCSLEVSRYLNPNTSASPNLKMFMRLMTLVSIPVTAVMPSAMVFYFVTSNIITTCIQLLWRIPFIRRIFNISTPKVAPPTSGPQPGFADTFMNAYKTSVQEAQPPQTSRQYERNMRKALRK